MLQLLSDAASEMRLQVQALQENSAQLQSQTQDWAHQLAHAQSCGDANDRTAEALHAEIEQLRLVIAATEEQHTALNPEGMLADLESTRCALWNEACHTAEVASELAELQYVHDVSQEALSSSQHDISKLRQDCHDMERSEAAEAAAPPFPQQLNLVI